MANVDARQFEAKLARLETLLRQAETSADPAARSRMQEIVQCLLELHGTALERLLEHVAGAGEAGDRIVDALARDDLVAGLLLLHGLHPLGVEDRVRQALDSVRPYLRSHGGSVELLHVREGVVRLRLEGSCHSCPSSAVTMQQTIEQAIYGKAPEITAIEVEGIAEFPPPAADSPARVALPIV